MPNSTGALRIGGNNIWSRVVRRPDRRGARLRPRPHRRGDPGGHEQGGREPATPGLRPSRRTSRRSARSARSRSPGRTRATTWASSATTSTARPRRASRRAPPTASASPTSAAFTDSPLSAGTYYYRVTAEDGAGNISIASSEANAVVTGDTTPPTAPSGLTANGSLSSVALAWTGSTDNVGVVRYNVHRSTTNGFTPSAANRIAQPAGTRYTDTGLAAGTYYYRVTAEDAAGNLSRPRTRPPRR